MLSLVPVFGLCQEQPGPTNFSRPHRAAVSYRYSDPSLLKLIFLGKNYRKVWATPVIIPQFDLTAAGLKVTGLGGGRQTKSLQLIDNDSALWVLRTIDKEVSNAIPKKIFRNKLTLAITQDMVSAAHPYAPLVVADLAKATKVMAADPVFYFVPDDPALGEYRNVFAGSVCLLERKEILPGQPVTLETAEMLDEFFKDSYPCLDMHAYGRARLLDMLIADWDRHQDQWLWAEQYQHGKKTFLSLPRDRDQALFYSNGLLVKIAPLAGLKHFIGLQNTTRNIKRLNKKSWQLDQLILNGLDRDQWKMLVDSFVAALPDSVIEHAVRRLPPEIYQVSGTTIQKKLVRRKKTLTADAMKYFDFISGRIILYGTDQNERFEIRSGPDSIVITILNDREQQILKRSISTAQTKEIKLIALGGNDRFLLSGEVPRSLALIMDGGAGENSYPEIRNDNVTIMNSGMTVAGYMPLIHEKLKIIPGE